MAEKVEYILSLKDLFTKTLINAEGQAEKFEGKVNNIFGRIGGAVAGTLATIGIARFGQDMVETGAKFDSYEAGLATLLKSAEQGKEVFEWYQQDAKATPFDTESIVVANRALISAGADAKSARIDVMNLANAIAATGGTSENLKSMAVNLNQIKSLGKASAMDIRQFVFAGIPIYQLLADATGKNVEQVKDMDVSYDLLSLALSKAAGAGGMFAGALDAQAASTSGQLSNLSEAIIFVKDDLYEALKPAIQWTIGGLASMVEGIKGVIKWGTEHATLVKTIGVFVGILAGGILLYNGYVAASIAITEAWTVAQAILNGTMALNPIGIVITAVAALAAGVYYLWNNFEGFRGTIMGVWEALKSFAILLKDTIVNAFLGVGKIIEGITTGSFEKIKDGAIDVGKGILAVTTSGASVAVLGGKELGKAFNKGYDEEVSKKSEAKSTLSSLANPAANNAAGFPVAPTQPKKDKIKSAVDGISGGRPTHITINIDSLIKNNTNQITTIKGDADLAPFMDKLKMALMTVLNDSQIIVG